jgi:hypothetical protein
MELFFKQLKELSPEAVQLEMEWIRYPTPEKLRKLQELYNLYPTHAFIKDKFDEVVIEWEKEQQAIADKHINIYHIIDSDVNCGYTFMGYNKNKQKWVVCGNEDFVESYKKIKNDEDVELFNKKYIRREESVNKSVIKELDDMYSTNKFERTMVYYKSKDPDDSGWSKSS